MTMNQAGNPVLNLQRDVDEFTRAYIGTAFWSSTEYAFGVCPCCGRNAILRSFPEPEFEQVPMCDAEGCGAHEIANPDPMDVNYDWTNLADSALEKMLADCAKFQAENQETINQALATGEVVSGPDFGPQGRAGHDFWLTRSGHGAGFWDGDWPQPFGDHLTRVSKRFGECNLYVGDDGKIHI